MITFSDVSFTYTGDSYVLQDLNLTIEKGQFVCVLGANGSGKSTFSKLINALLLPDKGTVTTKGMDTSDPEYTFLIRSSAGSAFQNPDDQLVASLVENDVAFGPENLGIENPELRERVTKALAQVGLSGYELRETTALSGGQKQRVAIAGILAMNPEILILDEASAMLDPRGRRGLMRVCKELHAQGMTIVMITHFMEEAAEADRIIVLEKGLCVLDRFLKKFLHKMKNFVPSTLPFLLQRKYLECCKIEELPVSTHINTETLKEELCRLHSNR